MVRETEVNLYQIGAIQDGIDGAIDDYDQLLDQMEVYNRLTNNSANEGLFIEDGRVYINASMIHAGYMSADYVHGGILDLGGLNNASGQLRIRDAAGGVIGTWDNTGLNVDGGTITGGTLETSHYTDAYDNEYYYAAAQDGFLCYLNGRVASRIYRNASDLTLESPSITLDGAVAVMGTFSAGQGISIPAAYGLETDSISSYSGNTVYIDSSVSVDGTLQVNGHTVYDAGNSNRKFTTGTVTPGNDLSQLGDSYAYYDAEMIFVHAYLRTTAAISANTVLLTLPQAAVAKTNINCPAWDYTAGTRKNCTVNTTASKTVTAAAAITAGTVVCIDLALPRG